MVRSSNSSSLAIENRGGERYRIVMNGDHYYLNDGETLQNKLRLVNRAELNDAIEKAEADARQRILANGDYPGLSGLQAIHHDTYKGLFRWAGKYRTADIEGDAGRYDPAAFVQPNLEYIFEIYEQAKTTGSLDRGTMGELLFCLAAAHPFWNGSRFTETLWLEVNYPNVLKRPRAFESAREKALLAGQSDALRQHLTKTTL